MGATSTLDSWEQSGKVVFDKLDRLHEDIKEMVHAFKEHIRHDDQNFKELNHNIGDAFKRIEENNVEIVKIKTVGVVVVFLWTSVLGPIVYKLFF